MSSVDVIRPPITTTASGCEMKALDSVRPNDIGSNAKMVATAVIRIGPQTPSATLDDRFLDAHTGGAVLVDQVEQHDGVGDHDADQHQQADHGGQDA